jgi:hypothetical protein
VQGPCHEVIDSIFSGERLVIEEQPDALDLGSKAIGGSGRGGGV